MRKYLKDYIEEIDKRLEGDIDDKDIENHLIKISFFKHERLIHLIVTVFYALFLLVAIYISTFIYLFVVVTLILVAFLIFYVRHYFFLENGVQYLYKQYDMMKDMQLN